MSSQVQFCTFHLGDLYLGVRVQDVQEVIRFQDMTRVPLAPSCVRGLINLRGQIVTAIDLRSLLAVPARAAGVQPMNVVVRTPDGAVSLLVDGIGDVLDVADSVFEPPPHTLETHARALIAGVYKLDGRLMLALDIESVLHASAPVASGAA